jgi:cytochrome c oxidase subunit 3
MAQVVLDGRSPERWSGGVSPLGIGWGKFMMWMFILSDAFTFGALLAVYGAARAVAPTWPDQAEVFGLAFVSTMTFILISSSATMAVAVHAAKRGDSVILERFLLLTILGGLTFLGMQVYEWALFINKGARLDANPWGIPAFSATFFVITGFHGMHVISGVLYLMYVLLRTRSERQVLDAWANPLRDRAGRRIDPGTTVRLLTQPDRPETTVERAHPSWGKITVLVPGKTTNSAALLPAEAVEVIEQAPEPPVPVNRQTHADRVENAGLYWHFVDLVWVAVFTLMYLI